MARRVNKNLDNFFNVPIAFDCDERERERQRERQKKRQKERKKRECV